MYAKQLHVRLNAFADGVHCVRCLFMPPITIAGNATAVPQRLFQEFQHFYRPQGKVMFLHLSVCSPEGGADSPSREYKVTIGNSAIG